MAKSKAQTNPAQGSALAEDVGTALNSYYRSMYLRRILSNILQNHIRIKCNQPNISHNWNLYNMLLKQVNTTHMQIERYYAIMK